MSILSESHDVRIQAGYEVRNQQGDYLEWYRALQEFLGSLPSLPGRTLADIQRSLRHRLKREPDDIKVFWLVTAHAALVHMIDEKIFLISSTMEELETYLRWEMCYFTAHRIH